MDIDRDRMGFQSVEIDAQVSTIDQTIQDQSFIRVLDQSIIDQSIPDQSLDLGQSLDMVVLNLSMDQGVIEKKKIKGRVEYQERLALGNMNRETQYQSALASDCHILLLNDNDIISEGVVDENGIFELEYPVNTTITDIRLIAKAEFQLNQQSYACAIKDHAQRTYGLSIAIDQNMLDQDQMINISLPPENSMGAALHILKTLKQGYLLISKYSNRLAPQLSVLWEKNQPFDCGSCYQGSKIFLGGGMTDPDEFDESVIIHEMGHYFVDHWSDDDSPGGSHRLQKVNPRLAYGEGIAYFWAGLVENSPIISDDMLLDPWIVDMEKSLLRGEGIDLSISNGLLSGNYREELVSSMLWDIYDAHSESEMDFDQINLSEATIMEILLNRFPLGALDLGAMGIDLSDFMKLVHCVDQQIPLMNLITYYQYPIDQDQLLFDLITDNLDQIQREDRCMQKSSALILKIHGVDRLILPSVWWESLTQREQEELWLQGIDVSVWGYDRLLVFEGQRKCDLERVGLEYHCILEKNIDGERALVLGIQARSGVFAGQWLMGSMGRGRGSEEKWRVDRWGDERLHLLDF